MYTRREFCQLTLAGVTLPAFAARAADSTVAGVHLGAQTYSFRDLPRPDDGDAVDVVIEAMTDCGLGECELYAPHIEPQFGGRRGARGGTPSPESQASRDRLRAWRLETPLDHFRDIRKKFDAAHISIYAFNYSFNRNFTDPEIDRGFEIMKALGAEIITASTTLEVAKRVVPFAEKHKTIVAMHGHSNVTDPNEFATPDSFACVAARR